MTVNNLDIPRNYSDDAPFTEDIVDEIVDSIETFALNTNQNIKQILLDLFSAGYQLDNDGRANYSAPLEDRIEFPAYLTWCDDFIEQAGSLGASIFSGAHWYGEGVGTQDIVADAHNGIIRLATTATASRSSSIKTIQKFLDTAYDIEIEWRMKVSSLSNCTVYAGLYKDTNDYFYFEFDSATSASLIYVTSKFNSGAEISTSTGETLTAATYKTFKMRVISGAVTMFINGVQVGTNHTGGIASSAAHRIFFYVDNKAAAENKNLDVDYVRVNQERA